MPPEKLHLQQFRHDLSLLLSCQRSVEDLNSALAEVLGDLFGHQPFRFYLNSGSTLAHNFTLYKTNQNNFDKEAELTRLEGIDLLLPVDEDEESAFFPALMDDKLIACIVCEPTAVEDVAVQLMCLLAVYCNVYLLISDSKTDGLTELSNRRSFDLDLVKELTGQQQKRRKEDTKDTQEESFLIIIDIDFFKRVNDQYGHLIGDEVLLKLAQVLKASFRQQDGIYRYGGEEFAVLLREIALENAEDVIRRFQQTVRATNFPTVNNVTVSIGYTRLCNEASPALAISHADKALYFAKDNGRDQMAGFEGLVESGLLAVDEIETDIELF